MAKPSRELKNYLRMAQSRPVCMPKVRVCVCLCGLPARARARV
jgi:hypothetical protein